MGFNSGLKGLIYRTKEGSCTVTVLAAVRVLTFLLKKIHEA